MLLTLTSEASGALEFLASEVPVSAALGCLALHPEIGSDQGAGRGDQGTFQNGEKLIILARVDHAVHPWHRVAPEINFHFESCSWRSDRVLRSAAYVGHFWPASRG